MHSHLALELDRARQADRDRRLAQAQLRHDALRRRRARPPSRPPRVRRAVARRLHALADRLAPQHLHA